MAENKFFTYKDRPLVRKGNTLYYGNMSDEYVVMMTVKDNTKNQDIELSNNITVQLLATDPMANPQSRVPKKSEKNGLYSALEIADIWLTRISNN